MPTKRKLKPHIGENKVEAVILYVDYKRYALNLCERHCLEVWDIRNKKNDHSNKARYGTNYGANNRTVNVGLSSDWNIPRGKHLDLFRKLTNTELKCDFCTGKYTLEFFKSK